MASKKHLKPTTSSSDDKDEAMETSAGEEESHNSNESSSEEDEAMETSAGEEESHNSNESSSEEDEPTKEKQQQTLTPPSSVVAATETKHLKPTTSLSDDEDEAMETSAGEEESHNSNESSSEEDEPTKEKQQQTLTPPSSVVAATETKRAKKKEKACGGSGEAHLSTKKRPREVTSKDNVSSRKIKIEDEKANVKKWSEEEEICLLQGIVKCKTRKNPILDNNGTYEFVKESLSIDVNSHQFIGKMYNLRSRYFRKRDNGKELSFSNAHDQKTFELSKLIWGTEKPKRSSVRIKKMEEDKKVMMMIHEGEFEDWFYNSFMAKYITSLGGDEDFVKRRWSKVTVEKKKMIEDKWRILINKDFEALMEKTKFLNEVASAIAQASTH